MPDQHLNPTMLTPDFDTYPSRSIVSIDVYPLGLEIKYKDGQVTRHLAADLREHSVAGDTTHAVTRETLLDPMHVPEGFRISTAEVTDDGFVQVTWSHKLTPTDTGQAVYHSGWLYQTGLYADTDFGMDLSPRLWTAASFVNIPQISGDRVLDDEEEYYRFLTTFIRYGAVLVRGLPAAPEMIETLPEKIGVIRSSNFGRIFEVKIKTDADSNAYTGEELRSHTDLATREYMPGLQFLFCLQNDSDGGMSTLADGFAIADHIRTTDMPTFELLSQTPINFVNKANTSDYRMAVPLFHLGPEGQLDEVRWTSWLRAPMRGDSLEEMDRLYAAQKTAYQLGNSEKFKVCFKLEAGDMICIDNRRVLHGRTSFDPASGGRWLRGCYMEREELWSGLRMAARAKRVRQAR
jgi:gamma-butyrobetaine dioxygenase